MLSLAAAAVAFAPVTPLAAPTVSRAVAPIMETKVMPLIASDLCLTAWLHRRDLHHTCACASLPLSSPRRQADLVNLANDLNPVVGYWDPLKLADYNFWGQGEEATIGWLREAEIKHGRIAMFGFCGFIVHANGIRTQGDGIVASIPSGLSAPETWDALPDIAKWQIILFVGVMESWRENSVVLAGEGQSHYMKGGSTRPCANRRADSPAPPTHIPARKGHTPTLTSILETAQSQATSRRSTCSRTRCHSISSTRGVSRSSRRRRRRPWAG